MPGELRAVISLDKVGSADAAWVGGKAAKLGELKRAGLPVPNGFVVLGEADADLERALEGLGDRPVAVRSSAVAEDLAEASFAGQYDTFLNLRGLDAVREAVSRSRSSAKGARVKSYRAERAAEAGKHIAVLVQEMVDADAAGVAFTANPVTGDRSEVLISAVRGLGERLVSGAASPDEWVVRNERATNRRRTEASISAEQATAVAELARRAAAHFDRPQDVEWAIAGDRLFLLQSRPITALPDQVEWKPPEVRGLHPPGPAYWLRNLRLGEWLPEPMTPLFQDWMLKLIDRGVERGTRADAGLRARLRHTVVNGWYYTTPEPEMRASTVLAALITHPFGMFRLASSIIKQSTDPELAERRFFGRVVRRWHEETLPRYRAVVAEGTARLQSAAPAEVPKIIERTGEAAGEAFWALAIGGGSAWKIEVALARFYHAHIAPSVDIEVPVLLAGLPPLDSDDRSHTVISADWYRPTLGESGVRPDVKELGERRHRLEQRRLSTEAACRAVLACKPELRRRFDAILDLSQRYAQLREQQASCFTLGWPVLRRCVHRLGAEAVAHGAIDDPDDAFFLTRDELIGAGVAGSGSVLRDRVRARRSEWERTRRLAAPISLGDMPKLLARAVASLEVLRSARPAPKGALHGEPSSPGRATGPVRVVRGPEDFKKFQRGEVLVAQATAPAWTPLFARAVAVVTDGGSLAAHASLVAREFGIPAVVATGNATALLGDGQRVTVDGSAGLVEVNV